MNYLSSGEDVVCMPVTLLKKQHTPCCDISLEPVSRLLADHIAKVRQVRRGEPTCLTIDSVESVYYVRVGSVKLVRYSLGGDEVVIDQYMAGSVFGNLCFCKWSLCCESIDREVAVALEDSEIVVTTFELLKKNINQYPEALTALLQDYCRRLAAARLRIESLVLHEAEERLARVLLILATYQQPGENEPVVLKTSVTHEELAHLIGVTRPFVTKLIGQLKERGFIESVSAGQLLVHPERIANAYS
jgi:CRP/FNR family transcriptional regulator, cyclic AMP receptor protein